MNFSTEWKQTNIQVFWGEIAPCHHLVQIYENERVFLETLEGFAGNGFISGETVVVIGTSAHLTALNDRLKNQGFDIQTLVAKNQYVPLDAEELLQKVMTDGRPDTAVFQQFATDTLLVVLQQERKVRLFGEMVFLLWEQGKKEAALELEHLWNTFLEQHEACVYCAYPKWAMSDNEGAQLIDICASHTTLIGGWSKPSTEIYYKQAAHA